MQKMANIKIVIHDTLKIEDKFWVPHKIWLDSSHFYMLPFLLSLDT